MKKKRRGIDPSTKVERDFAAKPATVRVKVRSLKKLRDAALKPCNSSAARDALLRMRDVRTFALDPKLVRDIGPSMLDARGRLHVVPASTLASTTPDERMLFGVRHGVYSFPTEELCNYLLARIAGRRAIEIGAGNGVLAEALGIRATDNRQQEDVELKAYYQRLGQPTVPYGDNVEKLDAAAAIAKYKPEVVIACWVTHRFEPSAPERGGSNTGVDEAGVVAACDEYIFVGNQHVHAAKPIWALAHERTTPDWLYSRAMNGTPDFIAAWSRTVR